MPLKNYIIASSIKMCIGCVPVPFAREQTGSDTKTEIESSM